MLFIIENTRPVTECHVYHGSSSPQSFSSTPQPGSAVRRIATPLLPSSSTTPTDSHSGASNLGVLHTGAATQHDSTGEASKNKLNARDLKAKRTIRGLKAQSESGAKMAQIAQQAKPMFHFLILDNPFGLENQHISHRSAAIRAIASVQSECLTLRMDALGVDYSAHEDIIWTVGSIFLNKNIKSLTMHIR
jgi:hypothetical protein